MRFLCVLALVLTAFRQARAKAVFAHFMVSNAQNYTLSDWADEIKLAQAAHIDAFALNTAYDQGDGPQYDLAFSAASSAGFKLFFSFDYAGNGPWPASTVLSVLNKFKGSSAHFLHNNKPFVSTFEGPGSASDWINIKSQTNCYFVPDWSSLGAKPAMELAGGVADGLFAWSAWPWGNKDMDTFVDASYITYLSGKPYMMPVSPWFYTNLPGYDKNWLWRGDSLWADRWGQVLYVQPEWVEIISWNDYGESHYIGPIKSKALGAMRTGRAPIDFVADMPHDGWREILPFAIDMYVRNTTTIANEKLVFWYRKQPAAACDSGMTTGNTASQLQLEFAPTEVSQDRVFYSAVLGSSASVSVTIGGVTQAGTWSKSPEDGVGLYSGSVPFNGNLGDVVVTISRGGGSSFSGSGSAISTQCGAGGLANWNAWVGSATGGAAADPTPTSMDDLVCINGTSIDNFSGLCSYACSLGYCPLGACLCTAMGKQRVKPKSSGITGYPAAGLNENFSGLCNFDCNLGYCPEGVCDTVPGPLTTPSVSPFSPTACTGGTGPGNFGGLCSYACTFGFCPRNICTCGSTGGLVETPPIVDEVAGSPVEGTQDYGLCAFACPRGYCPPGACVSRDTSGDGGAGGGPPVYINPSVWHDPTPIVSCIPPCVVVLPPYTLSDKTTIEFPPITKTFTEMWDDDTTTTTVVTITFPPVTTTEIPVYNINITNSGVDQVTYTITPSILPTAKVTFTPKVSATKTTSQDPVVIIITSTPVASKTYPVITNQPTKVSFTSTSPPGPTCSVGCGKICLIGCSSCGILGCGGICAGCGPEWTVVGGGTSGEDGDCIGPSCGSKKPDYDSEGNQVCQKDVITTTGTCHNGNYPVFDPLSFTVSCDHAADEAPDYMTECQKNLDKDLDQSVLDALKSHTCCPAAKRQSPLERRQAACGVDPDYPNNPPSNGLYHSVFTCDYSRWPNVCANAQSAIVSRNKSPIMTYAGTNARVGAMEKITEPWYRSKWESGPGMYSPTNPKSAPNAKGEGWGLFGCQVEEYPWGSGNPNRSPNLKRWDEQSVLRLIPTTENGDHGNFLQDWYKEQGRNSLEQAKGLIFSVSFTNGPSGTSDADFYVDADNQNEAKRVNICARPYGVPFLFVNHVSQMNAGERSYDPWWDNKLFDKTTRINVDKKGVTVKTITNQLPSFYCKYPAPGKSYWDDQANAWQPHPNVVRRNRVRGNKWYSCDNYPGYSGPAMMRRSIRGAKRGLTELTPAEVQELARQGANITTSDGRLETIDEPEDEGPEEMVVPAPYHLNPVGAAPPPAKTSHNVSTGLSQTPRRAAAGSFLDPSAFLYLGCGNDDEDNCALVGQDCSDPADNLDPADGDQPIDDTPDPTSTPPPAPEPTPDPVPTPTPTADCAFWDSLVAWQFEIYNIEGWVTDGGKKLKEEEGGCGAMTGWNWEEATSTRGAQVHFYLPFFMADGCVERAIVSAGGPKIPCKGSGLGKIAAPSSQSGTPTSADPATKTKTVVYPSPMPLPTSFEDATPITHEPYIPMVWGSSNATASSSTMSAVNPAT
ncbi:Glycoside hydrolase [Colletotrichum scovillei]|nr:Glycoside hydrolase [Colletotrichum scovillei]KAH8421754.1 Glycoside hydrolase [Colletotrichum scovillei]KAH8421906.1 Glycoside hydrolase [Colletotrichum scovillei]